MQPQIGWTRVQIEDKRMTEGKAEVWWGASESCCRAFVEKTIHVISSPDRENEFSATLSPPESCWAVRQGITPHSDWLLSWLTKCGRVETHMNLLMLVWFCLYHQLWDNTKTTECEIGRSVWNTVESVPSEHKGSRFDSHLSAVSWFS